MTRINLFFLLFLLLTLLPASRLRAQQAWPVVYEIKQDSLPEIKLDRRHWQFLVDSSGRRSLREVQGMQLRQAPSDSLRIRMSRVHVYWLRYGFKNTLPRSVRIVLPREVDRVDVYTADPTGRWTAKTTGAGVAWSKRSDSEQFAEVVLLIDSGQQVQVYERRRYDVRFDKMTLDVRVRVGDDDPARLQTFYDSEFNDTGAWTLASGFMLLAIVVTLFFYAVSREKLYLYFSFFGMAFILIAISPLAYFAFLKEYPTVGRFNGMFSSFICLVFLWRFLALFYQLPSYYRRWYRLNLILSYGFLIVIGFWGVGVFFGPVHSLLIAVFFIAFLLSGGLSLFWGVFRKGEGRTDRLVTALPFLAMGFAYIILDIVIAFFDRDSLRKELLSWSGWVIWGCFYWLVVSFMWILIKRFQLLQRQVLQETLERERLARENEREKAALIAAQKIELEQQVTERTAELKQSLTDLKLAQNQLIQAEKMASLGELTAGIAHEIQNPLNFVNNFSEVSIELVDELGQEVAAGNQEDVAAIADDLKQNLSKIHHHGKRADSIVKGMLEHSRIGNGVKEPTDINKLVDEYLRLSYHGLRAKDSTFQCKLVTSFDEGLGAVAVVPQDIGRVLLNLFNNAFYAVQQKQQTTSTGYQPVVEASTFVLPSGGCGVTIRDNGVGIPAGIRDKIMQPFFTTKPTGQGTGLGLSLSYDIVVKGHGGAISVESTEGEGTVFTLHIPAR